MKRVDHIELPESFLKPFAEYRALRELAATAERLAVSRGEEAVQCLRQRRGPKLRVNVRDAADLLNLAEQVRQLKSARRKSEV